MFLRNARNAIKAGEFFDSLAEGPFNALYIVGWHGDNIVSRKG
jgi:hypothetical protein